jgi:hypothetical protein
MADMLFCHFSLCNAITISSLFIHIATCASMNGLLLNIGVIGELRFFWYYLFHLQAERTKKIIK